MRPATFTLSVRAGPLGWFYEAQSDKGLPSPSRAHQSDIEADSWHVHTLLDILRFVLCGDTNEACLTHQPSGDSPCPPVRLLAVPNPSTRSVPNRRFLRKHDGLSLIQHCLERVSPQHMTQGALTQACRLTERIGSWSEDWADSAIASLLAPSRMWVFAPSEAQLTLAGVLRGLAQRCPGRMRRMVGVQRCLDALDLYYWYTPPYGDDSGIVSGTRSGSNHGQGGTTDEEDGGKESSSSSGRRHSRTSVHGTDIESAGSMEWSYVSRRWVRPSTGEILGLKVAGPALQEIRARLLDAAVLMAGDGDGIGRADVLAVLGFLRGCRDDLSRREALRLVIRLTDDPHQAGRFAVASGYVATEIYAGCCGGDMGDVDGELRDMIDGPARGPGKGGAAIALVLSLVRAPDPAVRLLAFLALAQVSTICWTNKSLKVQATPKL